MALVGTKYACGASARRESMDDMGRTKAPGIFLIIVVGTVIVVLLNLAIAKVFHARSDIWGVGVMALEGFLLVAYVSGGWPWRKA